VSLLELGLPHLVLRPFKSAEQARRKLAYCPTWDYSFTIMRPSGGIVLAVVLAVTATAPAPGRRAPLHDPVVTRIGLICRWERTCIQAQRAAMLAALDFVDRRNPPLARVHICNRNASRGLGRVDWVGFYNCIRNGRIGR
jgi:hypothetical protein